MALVLRWCMARTKTLRWFRVVCRQRHRRAIGRSRGWCFGKESRGVERALGARVQAVGGGWSCRKGKTEHRYTGIGCKYTELQMEMKE
jgi:hypothetical protein